MNYKDEFTDVQRQGATDGGLFGSERLNMATSATAKIFNDADAKRKKVAVQGPASGQVANVGQLLSLLQDQKLLPPTETANPTRTSAHSDESEDLDGSEPSDLEPAPANTCPKPRAVNSFRLGRGYNVWIGFKQQRATSRSQGVRRTKTWGLGPSRSRPPASGHVAAASGLRPPFVAATSGVRPSFLDSASGQTTPTAAAYL